jgi:hypothetical protein
VAIVDVNGDNKLDIIVANFYGANVGVFFNTGNGTFAPQTTYSYLSFSCFNSGPISLVTVDINRDNKPDIIVTQSAGNCMSVFINTGNGTFTTQIIFPTGSDTNPISVAAADVNSDNKPDIIVANFLANNVGVFLGDC